MVPGSLGLPKTPRQRTLDEDGFGFAPPEMWCYTLLLAPRGRMRENKTSRDPANALFF